MLLQLTEQQHDEQRASLSKNPLEVPGCRKASCQLAGDTGPNAGLVKATSSALHVIGQSLAQAIHLTMPQWLVQRGRHEGTATCEATCIKTQLAH